MVTPEIIASISKSVLCWLATCDQYNVPNVSPKEIFHYFDPNQIIIANIASPQTVKNIKVNPNICISFIDILVQKGYQLKGIAKIITPSDPSFEKMNPILQKMTKGKYPYATITAIDIQSVKPIIAPKYILYPDTTEAEQIYQARKAYFE